MNLRHILFFLLALSLSFFACDDDSSNSVTDLLETSDDIGDVDDQGDLTDPDQEIAEEDGDALEETTPDDLVDEDQSIAETTDQVDFDSLTCAALGASCTEDESCCEGRCIEGSCSNCLNIGVSCSEGSDCCSGECAANEDGSMVCQYPACVEDGDPCEAAADCCSLACNDGLCGGGSCLSTGEECTDDADCCTNICEAGTCGQSQGLCSVAGESCTSDGACCSLSCSGEAGDMRCDAGDVCRAVGEVCEYDEDCCLPICEGGFCQPAPDTSGQLACGVVGEPCDTNHDCCSFACVANADGFKACRATGGCASFGELCTADSDCCNQEGRCNDETEVGECTLFPDRTIGRCSELKGGLPAGHTCEDGFNPGSQCCGGAGYCIETASGISKCFGDLGCDPLTDPSCCIPTGESCQFTEQCCEGLCAADLDGNLVCNPDNVTACTPEGDACISDGDCCHGECNSLGICGPEGCVELEGECTEDADCCAPGYCDEGVCTSCIEDGTACEADSDCCSGYCNGETGLCDQLTACVPEGEVCVNDSQCCDGFLCDGGVCSRPCLPLDQGCTYDGDCCSGYCDPVSHTCGENQGCTGIGGNCADSEACCEGLICLNGSCQIVN